MCDTERGVCWRCNKHWSQTVTSCHLLLSLACRYVPVSSLLFPSLAMKMASVSESVNQSLTLRTLTDDQLSLLQKTEIITSAKLKQKPMSMGNQRKVMESAKASPVIIIIVIIIRPRHSHSAVAYSCHNFPWTICQSVHMYVRPSVCAMHCGKTADRIRMPFGIVDRTCLWMRQIVRFVDRSTGRGTFGGEFRGCHCNQWGLYGVRMQQRRNAALFPNYFGQTCYMTALLIRWQVFQVKHFVAFCVRSNF